MCGDEGVGGRSILPVESDQYRCRLGAARRMPLPRLHSDAPPPVAATLFRDTDLFELNLFDRFLPDYDEERRRLFSMVFLYSLAVQYEAYPNLNSVSNKIKSNVDTFYNGK